MVGKAGAAPNSMANNVTKNLFKPNDILIPDAAFNPTLAQINADVSKGLKCPFENQTQKAQNGSSDVDCSSWNCRFISFLASLLDPKIEKNAKSALERVSLALSSSLISYSMKEIAANPLDLLSFMFSFEKKLPAKNDTNTSKANNQTEKKNSSAQQSNQTNLKLFFANETNTTNATNSTNSSLIEKNITLRLYSRFDTFSQINYKGRNYIIESNGLLVAKFDSSCKRKLLATEIIPNTLDGIKKLNEFVQGFLDGNIIAIVQKPPFNWAFVKGTTIQLFLYNLGFPYFEELPRKLEKSTFAFAGIFGAKHLSAPLNTSLNEKSELKVDFKNHPTFSNCENNNIFVKTTGSFEGESEDRKRIVSLNGKEILNDTKSGISIVVLSCQQGKFEKFNDSNYDLISPNKTIETLLKDLKNLTMQNYIGIPIFVLSTFGKFDEKWKDQPLWQNFSKQIQRLGGSSFIAYLDKEFKDSNGTIMGHPYILVGSPKFPTLSGGEFFLDGKNSTSPELSFDLTARKIFCPTPLPKVIALQKLSDIVDYETILKQKSQDLTSQVNKLVTKMLFFSNLEHHQSFEEDPPFKIKIKGLTVGNSQDKLVNLIVNGHHVCKHHGKMTYLENDSILICEKMKTLEQGEHTMVLLSELGRQIDLGSGFVFQKSDKDFEVYIKGRF